MMQSLRKEWLILFIDMNHVIPIDTVFVTIICNDKVITDDILLYSNHVLTIIRHFFFVAQVFTKYRLSFKLTKCDFFKPRVESVDHHLTTYGN